MKPLTDEQIDNAIGMILRIGVILLGDPGRGRGRRISYGAWNGASPGGVDLDSGNSARSFHGQPLFIVQLGLLALMATPIVRVIACVVGFALEHDRTYAIISAIVLSCLIFSLI